MSFIISTSSHKFFSQKLSRESKIPMINSQVDYFANGELKTSIMSSIRGKNIFIVSSPNSREDASINDDIMETYFLIRTCKISDVANITLICPCYPYARQDKKDDSRVCISAKDIADLFTLGGINRIICFDLHSHQIQGFFNIPCDNFYCINIIHKYLIENLKIETKDTNELNNEYVIVAPDEGALRRVNKYASKFNMPFMVVSKDRDYSKVNHVEKAFLIGDKTKYLQDRTAIIIDDMADTCGTVLKVSELLMEKGAKSIIIIVTHGILSGPAINRINKSDFIEKVIVSDSLPQESNLEKCPKLMVFSIIPLLSQAMNRLITNESLSELF
tara:strand:+ start:462 stop:1454 length:993 start_codon:yes stop_codon:yes gene_type:complete